MGRQTTQQTTIGRSQVEGYLRRAGFADARVLALRPLGEDDDGLKSYGYGRPLRATFTAGGTSRDLVFRTMSPDPFGHNRRSARAETLLLGFDTFNDIPRHIRAVDIGAFDEQGEMLPMGVGEVFLVTDYVEGELYAKDLVRLQRAEVAAPEDRERARALAEYLADLHAARRDPADYARAIRDTIGGGEGIFGLCDSYPDGLPAIPLHRLNDIEMSLIRWRWRLRDYAHRVTRTHGDFHPYNILFRAGADFSVLDCSRGAVGDPADDVTCLSLNYLFFALDGRGRFDGPLRQLWDDFWHTYLERSRDRELCTVVAPFFTWRALVLASPVWYPDVATELRDRLLTFAERLLAGVRFDPHTVDALLA
jgi:aminoglycoside phosphotransferase (APT) family kinase protein